MFHARRLSRSLVAPFLATCLAACGGEDEGGGGGRKAAAVCRDQPLQWTGNVGVPTPATVLANVFAVSASVNGVNSHLVVDTGAPITLLDLASYPGAGVANGTGTVSKLDTLGLSFTSPNVVGTDLPLEFGGVKIAGLLGSDVLCHFSTSFNYRDEEVTLGLSAPPADLEPARSVPFELLGGGIGSIGGGLTEFSATRIVVTANVEGTPRDFIVDSGASLTIISPKLFDSLVKDGRGKVGGLETSTVTGSTQARVTRVKSFELEGVNVEGELVAEVGPLYSQALSAEVGRPVEGLLGGSMLRHFFVTADYETGKLHLSRYQDTLHIKDEFKRLGMALTRSTPTAPYTVAQVLPGSDAQLKGVELNSEILSIDATPLQSLDAEQVDVLLRGQVGLTKRLELPAGRTLDVKVEEFLPLSTATGTR